jgi:hypothetical protein
MSKKTKPKNALAIWFEKATPEQRKQLAKFAKTSVASLSHAVAGRRGISAELAQRLVHASKQLGHRALYLDQQELCAACAACPIAKLARR